MPRFLLLSATLLVCLLAAPLAAAERAVSPPPFGGAHSQQWPSDIAWNGDQGFILWADWRPGSKYLAYGARIDAAGNVLDPGGIPLDRRPDKQTTPLRVIWASDAWVVFWTDGPAIFAQRISAEGWFLGDAVTIDTSLHPEMPPRSTGLVAATIGNSILVATFGGYYQTRLVMMSADLGTSTPVDIVGPDATLVVEGQYVIAAADRVFRLSPNGAILSSDPSPFSDPPVCPSCVRQLRRFAWTGRDYLMVWKSGDMVFGRRVTSDLSTRGELFEIARVDANVMISAIVNEGDGRASVILRRDGTGEFEYLHVPVSATDEVGTMKTFARTGPQSGVLRESPSGHVLIQSNLVLQWLSDDFETLRTTKLETESFARQQNMSAVRDGMANLVVFGETEPEPAPEFGGVTQVKIGRPGTIAKPIFETGRPQDAPGIASNGRNALAVWLEKAGTSDVRVMSLLVSLDGEALNPSPDEIGRASYTWNTRGGVRGISDYEFAPVVVWSGQMYLVLWKSRDGVMMARVLEDGKILDSGNRLESLLWPHKLIATRVADMALLVWSYGGCPGIPCSPLPSRIFAARLTPDGQPIDAQPILISEGEYSYHPDVAANGTTALIVWESGAEIVGRRITSGGYLYEQHPFRIGPYLAFQPAVAKHHDGFHVAWQDAPEWVIEYAPTVRGVTVSATGEVSSPTVLATHTFQPEGPFAWTTPSGAAAVAWSRTSVETGFVPRLLYSVIGETWPTRVRTVRR
jgi:hypothetical protein